MKEPTVENLVKWVNEIKKGGCTNCRQNDFTVGNEFGYVELIKLDTPQHFTQFQEHKHVRFIILLCKNCGKAEFYDAFTAGFTKRLE